MNLREFLRDEWKDYLRQFLIKDKCEECDEVSHLELHHASARFEELLFETLRELKLKEKDTDDYSEKELKMVSELMLGKQIKIVHKTLCKIHHKKAHDECKAINPLHGLGSYFFVDIKALKEKKIEPLMLVRYIRLASSMSYDNVLEGKYVQEALGTDAGYAIDLVKELAKVGLVKIEKHDLRLNDKYVKKGTCTFNERNVFSVKNFNFVYEKTNKNHEVLGKLIYANTKREQIFTRKLFAFNKKDLKKFRDCLFIKTKGYRTMFNPDVLLFESHRTEEVKEIYKNF